MDYKIDLHVHSNTNPHVYSTIKENIDYAKSIGMKVIAITNHGPALDDSIHWWAISNIKILPEYIEGVRVLKGVEANIVGENGELDINQAIYKNMDIILAGFHGTHLYAKNKDIEKNTRAAINLMKTQKIDILAHPGNPQFPIDYKEVVRVAKEMNVAIEINNNSLNGARKGSEENCKTIARYAKEMGCYICVNTDAHFYSQIGHTPFARKIVDDLNYPKELILNYSEEILNNFLELRKKLRPKKIDDTYINTYYPKKIKGGF